MKGSKNRMELTQVKAIQFFLHINKRETSIYYNKEIHSKNILSGCVVRSERRIDLLFKRLHN